jgi:Gpi18-like mannosyltransferase
MGLKFRTIKQNFNLGQIKLPAHLASISAIVLVWRVCLEFISQTLAPAIQPSGGAESYISGVRFGLARWMRWDGTWYMTIINSGYHHHASAIIQQENIAFYPAFPILVRLINDVTRIPYAYAGLILNFFLTIATCYFGYLLYATMKKKYGKHKTDHGFYVPVFFILAFPTAFFFAAFYSEALLVLALTASLYFALNRRYWAAALFAGLATGSKIIGIIAAPTILILYIEQENVFNHGFIEAIKKRWLTAAGLMITSVSGIVLYMAYLWVRFGNPLLSYDDNQAPGWGRKVGGFFITNISTYYQHIFDPKAYGSHINYLTNLSLAIVPIVALLLVAYALYKRIWWMALYAFLMIILPLSTGSLMSVNRLALVLMPCFIGILATEYSSTKRFYIWSIVALMAVAEIVLASFFLQGTYFIG